MKMKFILLLMVTFASASGFALPETQAEWVKEALTTPEETLVSPGAFRCQHTFSAAAYFNPPPVMAFGSDLEIAKKNVFLLCVKKRCEGLNQEISASLSELQKLSDQDFSAFLKIWGKSQAQIEIALEKRHHPLPPTPTCQIASQVEAVFGGCYIAHLKVQCQRLP